ncbi:MAG: NAD+ synthase, partial [Armatimonadota bacterium]
MDRFELDWERVADVAAAFIRERMAAARRDAAVIGLSGGIDSAVSAFLTARALGADRVTALMLPYHTSSGQSLSDALLVREALGIAHEVIEITPMVDAYFDRYPDADRLRRANMMARQRMAVLYDQSERLDALVVGTGNLTEALLGYTTLWGDMACAFNPLGDLYKTQVRRLAEYLGVPGPVRTKPPTADLWQGQTDEDELGFSYEQADLILACLTEDR